MRLGTCVVFELLAGIGITAGIGFGVVSGVGEVRDFAAQEAQAASLRTRVPAYEHGTPGRIEPLEQGASLVVPPAQMPPPVFEGVRDDLLLEPIRTGRIARVKFNRGGSSVSLRIDFSNGARAAFKPQQTNLQTVPRREIAAYRVNRLVGMASVAPAIGGRFKVADIEAALRRDQLGYIPRLRAEMITDSRGYVRGELSWWIPVISQAKISGYRIDGTDGIVTWKRYLTVGRSVPASDYRMASQISNMVLFDHLINNSDRFTGGNARASVDGEFLYFMDNTLSFGISDDGHERTRIYLQRSQKFSRGLVQNLRDLTFEQLRGVLSLDVKPFSELVSDNEIRSMLQRRDFSMAYIDGLIELHGEEAVLVFP